MSTIFLETHRLILRQWQESDHEPFIQLNADKEVMEFFPSTSTRDESLAQIERLIAHIDQYGFGFFAIERKDNHEFIGFTGLANVRFESHFTPCVEIGWRLNKANWNQGFATEAASACLKYAFDILKLNEVYSYTSVDNNRSEHVMKKIRMNKVGVFDHPLIEKGHVLKLHVLYKSVPDVQLDHEEIKL